MDEKINKLNHIDLLRGVAIILVVITHVSLTAIGITEKSREILILGRIGVQLFFILSAYTLCLSMSSRKEEHSILNFYLRRYFRIAPLYYVGILVYTIFCMFPALNQGGPLSHSESYTSKNIILNVLFLHGFFPKANNTIVPGGWSIATEMLFYLMFPLFFLYYNKIKKVLLLFLIPLSALLIAIIYEYLGFKFYGERIFTTHFPYGFIINQLPIFIIGMSYFYIDKFHPFSFKKELSLLLFSSLFILALILMLKWTRDISISIFIAGISFCFLFDYFKRSVFNFNIISRIGQLSFSIYIFHFLFAYPLAFKISTLLANNLNAYLILLINFIITIILSSCFALISEKYIEKAGINLGKFFIRKSARKTN